MQRTILGCSVLGLHLLKQGALDASQAIDEALTVIDAVDAGQQPFIDLTDDALIEVHTLLTTAYVASQTVEVGETQCLLPQHQAFYRAAMGLQFLPEVPLKQKAITLLLLQLILDDHENDTVFSFEPEARTKLQLIQRINVLHQALLKCVSKNQSLYFMWRVFNPDSHSKIVAFSEQDRNIDWVAYKIQACEAIEAASRHRMAEIDTATQALKIEFEHRKQLIRDYYATMIAVECSKIDADTADMKRAAKRQREKDAVKLLVITAASAGVASCVGAALKASMLAANAAASAAAAGAGATLAAPTLTFTQTMLLGGATGLSMSTTQALMTGDNVLKRALEGGVLGAAAGGVGYKLGQPTNPAQIFKKQAIQSATSASLHAAFHGGNLGQNIVMAVAANTVAHGVLPIDDMDGLSLTEKSLRTAGHASVMVATASAFHTSPEARANIVIAALAGMITPVAESAGQGVGEHVVAPGAQAVVFKQAPKAMKASESLTQGEYVFAEPLKTTPQQHFALKGTSQEMQQRFIEIGWNERSRAAVPKRIGVYQAYRAYWAGGVTSPDVIAWQQQNRASLPRLAQGSDALNSLEQLPLFLGTLQLYAGAAQMIAAPLGGPVLGSVVGGIGIDNFVTATQTLWSGQHHETSVFHAVHGLGESTGLYGTQGAAFIECVVNLATMNPEALVFSTRQAGQLMVKTTQSAAQRVTRIYDTRRAAQAALYTEFPEVALVRNSLDKSKQNMLRMWDGYRNNPLPNSVADGLRLRTELAFQQAGILNAEGRLTAEAIGGSKAALKKGSMIGNPRIRDMLIKDGSRIEDWTKRASPSITLPNGQRVRIHYYENTVTKKIDYSSHDFKIKGRVESLDGPIYRRNIETDFNGHLPKNK